MKLLALVFHRAPLYFLALVLQMALLVWVAMRFQSRFYQLYALNVLVSVVIVVYILNDSTNPAYKIAWIIPILLLPVFGGLVYLIHGRTRLRSSMRERLGALVQEAQVVLPRSDLLLQRMETESREAALHARYLVARARAPLFVDTAATFLPTGEAKHAQLLAALRAAQRYIFLEYFIIQPGFMWDGILEILKERVRNGVIVRVMYDDAGCMVKLPRGYHRFLEQQGIQCAVFNPVWPFLTSMLHHRDHRKIAVIDGTVAFTGGVNLADEYINKIELFGHWKDTAVELRGPAAWSLTVMFLTVWSYLRAEMTDYATFEPTAEAFAAAAQGAETSGYVQPFDDSPLDDERVGQNVYLGIIARAQRYIYITTPYLIVDNEIFTALCLAAKSGVDVRITTPHIADKAYVHAVTRTYYRPLIESGVRLYEYLPGFIHSKTVLSDDTVGVVGTINMDYRSLFLHFECAVLLQRSPCLALMHRDYLHTIGRSRQVTIEDLDRTTVIRRLTATLLRVFAPLL